MNSFRMKALSLAVLSLAGLGMAGSAFAACPVANTTKGLVSPGGGGAWTSQFIANDATLDIHTPGLNGTNCSLAISLGAAGNSRAAVQDNSPTAEQRYRARFYIDLNNLITSPNGFGASNRTAVIFRINDATGPGQFSSDQLGVRIAGGATPSFRFFLADSNSASTGATQVPVPFPASANNVYRVEFDLQIGTGATNTSNGCTTMPVTGGCFRAWVTDAAATTTDAAPTASATINNAAWSGAETVFLGLQAGSPGIRASNAGIHIYEDEFDSRRQTFIGK